MTARLLQHPLHPALAHFPLAFWVGATVSDLLGLETRDPLWWTVSRYAVIAGALTGALALLAGALEALLRNLPREARPWLIVHAGLMGTALLCFMVSLSWRAMTPPPRAALALSFVGTGIVLVGGFCGGTLVYRYGVGVGWRSEGKE
jgi:uncharacterized membrane protein